MLWDGPNRRWLVLSAAMLFVVLFAELFLSVRQNSQTFDETAHIYAGYSYWKHGDFGINPEHPPLAKMVATIPLLPMHLAVQPPLPIHFRAASALGGRQFLYTHDADKILLRSRMAMSVFTYALALLVFFCAREMFGNVAAVIALLLFVFEPNILANGALVTTDMALSATLFAAVYAFYRYTRSPTVLRLLVCAVSAGLVLCVKHSGLIIFPLLVLLAVAALLLPRDNGEPIAASQRRIHPVRLAVALLAIVAIAYGMLWSVYGFRYAARPGGTAMTPPTAVFLTTLHRPMQARLIGVFERHHLLPESYLYGLTDVAVATSKGRPAFIFGRLYPAGEWFYFPSTFLIKSTIAFLLLLVLALTTRELWRRNRIRELVFMLLPALVYFTIAVCSHLNIGHRHILPIYAFLIVIAAGGGAVLLRRSRAWAAVVVVLLLLHVFSSVRAYPAYLAYSNEVWGGPQHTWEVLTDSNTGWGSGLKTMQEYIREHNVQNCWLAYSGPADLSYFHMPCKPLPTFFSTVLRSPQGAVPVQIQGPIFIGSLAMTGWGWGPMEANPYNAFVGVKPDDVLYGEILVYNGSYTVPRLAAISHMSLSQSAVADKHPDVALAEAQQAEMLAPEILMPHEILSALYATNHEPAAASREYETALHLYNTAYKPFASEVTPPKDSSALLRSR
ncbi:MAG TPA: phospholipid carrier-dependent glycosyltransferase [Bryocella sp.]|nr:phospholipid carrier-dependent glycosyltransferase [Bryocella sp.]